MKNTIASLLFILVFPVVLCAQNVGIGTAAPADKLEIRNPVRSAARISSNSYSDTSQLILSNRNASQQGTDFKFSSNAEQGLRLSSASDLANNSHDSILMITPDGRVGINNINPAQRLDVNGNVNINGSLLANGVDGTAGQVLMKNTSGIFSWGNISGGQQYEHSIGFSPGFSNISPVNTNWVIPAGVTKLFIEVWGPGGGGAAGGGGGGGGYGASEWQVTPGATVAISFGGIGLGETSSTAATNAGNTVVTINSVTLTAYGGEAAASGGGGFGGSANTNSSLPVIVAGGSHGEVTKEQYGQYNSTVFYTARLGGNGGQGGNTSIANQNGGFRSFNNSTNAIIKTIYGGPGVSPGGGGGGDASGVAIANYGGTGLVIIHY